MKRFGQFAARSLLVTTTALSASVIANGVAQADIADVTVTVKAGKLKVAGKATAGATIARRHFDRQDEVQRNLLLRSAELRAEQLLGAADLRQGRHLGGQG